MSYRVPVLETYPFQKQVLSITDSLPVADGSHKGHRYLYIPADTGDTNPYAKGSNRQMDIHHFLYR